MNIVLIGYRGSGKTSIGTLLAARLGKVFVDVDAEACKRFGDDSIAAIWEKHGEPAWRREEVAVTQELCARDGQVISLGGGTLMQPAARKAVESADAVRVYLKCSPEELARRISLDPKSNATRPHLTPHGGGVEEIRQVLKVREPVYLAVADEVFDVTDVPAEDAVQRMIERYLGG